MKIVGCVGWQGSVGGQQFHCGCGHCHGAIFGTGGRAGGELWGGFLCSGLGLGMMIGFGLGYSKSPHYLTVSVW